VTTRTQTAEPAQRRRWRLASEEPADGAPLVERVLRARGLDDPAAAAAVLNPTLLAMHPPEELPGIDAACRRLLAAAAGGERIAIYGDYDVDGITATAILYHTLRLIAPANAPVTYVPHRLDEGYGLNTGALEELAASGVRLVVSVDCGITALAEAERARELGIDLIITDHHNPRSDGSLPSALALVHPRLPGSAYPFGELCGAGVAYKLAWRLAVLHAGRADGRVGEAAQSLLIDLLAFAALGSIADMVPLVGENRVITRFGLSRMRTARFEGLRELIAASGLDGAKVDADDVGFRLAPRLNACGRMGHAGDAVELFTTAAGPRARAIAAQLHEQNTARQATERRITEQACELAEASGMTGPDRRAIVLRHAEWHPGVVGIACSRLVDRFARPVLLLCDDGAGCKGSGRSIPGFNLHAGLAACAGHLRTFGGHDAAAGLSLESAGFDGFAEAFIAHANATLAPDDLVNELRIDCEASTGELTLDGVSTLDRLRPFGRGNPRVRLLLRGATISREPETFGAAARHLALHLAAHPGPGTGEGPSLRCIAWNAGDRRATLRRGQRLDAVITPQVSSFSGRVEPVVEDWRPA
jgi:single-stranded-DNA-specific exonuclease